MRYAAPMNILVRVLEDGEHIERRVSADECGKIECSLLRMNERFRSSLATTKIRTFFTYMPSAADSSSPEGSYVPSCALELAMARPMSLACAAA